MCRVRRMKINPAKAMRFADRPSDLARFFALAKLDPATGCWLWQGYTDDNGYGQFKVNGRAVWAHRYSYAACKGPIPAGREIDHKRRCSSASCVNPAHLQKRTALANATDGGFRRHREREAIPI